MLYDIIIVLFYVNKGWVRMPFIENTTQALTGLVNERVASGSGEILSEIPFLDNIAEFFSKATSLNPGITDILDIAFVAFVLYNGIKLIRETRAFQLVKGLLFLGVIYLFVSQLEMQASSYIFRFVFQNIFIILIILFQQEIRHILERVGKSRLSGISHLFMSSGSGNTETVSHAIIEIAKAVQRMSDSKTGSLIVMEKETLLGDVIKTGTGVDAAISHELIGNIFFPKSPLHDGAAVVRNGRLLCAGCVLPLTKNDEISSDLGTRHRAALGMSEQSDAMIIVTSEETGTISVAFKGVLMRGLNESELREKLMNYLIDNDSEGEKGMFKKLFKGWKK